MITYGKTSGKMWGIKVLLEGKWVGSIRHYPQGYTYKPKGQTKPGEFHPSLEALKAALEAA